MGDRLWHAFGSRTNKSSTPQPQAAAPTTARDRRANVAASQGRTNAKRSLRRAQADTGMGQIVAKVPLLARFSSYMGFGTATKNQSRTRKSFPELRTHKSEPTLKDWDARPENPTESTQPTYGANHGYANKELDRTWHNPSLQQMMETVSSVIMTNGTSESIPRHLNGFVAGMIEEFRIRLSQGEALRKKFDELQATREKEGQQYAATAQEWETRETAFKAEINRLEHIIAQNQKGAKSVMLARASSMCSRNDARAFKNNVQNLSITEEDEIEAVSGEPVKTIGDGTGVLLDSNADVKMSEQLRNLDITSAHVKRANMDNQMQQKDNATEKEPNVAGANAATSEPPKPRKSDSSATTACSVTAMSSPSASLITQGLLAQRTGQEPVTPHTTPPPGPKPKMKQRGGGFEAIRELIKVNGGLPEQVVEEEDEEDDYYSASFVPPRPTQRFSFSKQKPPTADKPSAHESSPDGVRASGKIIQKDGPSTPCGDPSEHRDFAPSRVATSPQGSQKANSALLQSMGRNLVEERKKGADQLNQHGKGSPGSASPCGSSGSSRGTPTRKAQSGSDPFPDEATKYAYRHARLVTNAHIRATSSLMEEDITGLAQLQALYPNPGVCAGGAAYRPRPPAHRFRGGLRGLPQRSIYQRHGMHRPPERVVGPVRPPQGLEHVIAARRQVVRLAPGYGNAIEEQPSQVCHQLPAAASTAFVANPEAEESSELKNMPDMEDDNEVPREFLIEPEIAHE